MTEKKELTPSAKQLQARISAILAESKKRPAGHGFADDAMQDALRGMTAAQMLELSPPSVEAGLWTNDSGFCRRLGALLFGVSVESVDELSWQYYLFFVQIVTANFIKSMEAAIPS